MLIVFEGIHGCGKSTQMQNLFEWIKDNTNFTVVKSQWNSYPGLQEFNDNLKGRKLHTPMSFSLIHALDSCLRYDQIILPCLQQGGIALVDRYIYTAYVRDGLRNISETLLNEMYGHYAEPDLILYFMIEPRIALDRIKNIKNRSELILGLDLNYSADPAENFLKFLEFQDEKYCNILKNKKDKVFFIDASKDVETQFSQILEIFKNKSKYFSK